MPEHDKTDRSSQRNASRANAENLSNESIEAQHESRMPPPFQLSAANPSTSGTTNPQTSPQNNLKSIINNGLSSAKSGLYNLASTISKGILEQRINEESTIWGKNQLMRASVSEDEKYQIDGAWQLVDYFIDDPDGFYPQAINSALIDLKKYRVMLLEKRIKSIENEIKRKVDRNNNRLKKLMPLMKKRAKWQNMAKGFSDITDNAKNMGGPSIPGTSVGLSDMGAFTGGLTAGGLSIAYSYGVSKQLETIDAMLTDIGQMQSDNMFRYELIRAKSKGGPSFNSIKDFKAAVEKLKNDTHSLDVYLNRKNREIKNINADIAK